MFYFHFSALILVLSQCAISTLSFDILLDFYEKLVFRVQNRVQKVRKTLNFKVQLENNRYLK